MSADSSRSSTAWIAILLLAVLAIGGLWWGVRTLALSKPEQAAKGGGGGGPRPATVVVSPVRKIEIQETHLVVGTLRAAHRSEVAAREDGAIAEVRANEGDPVKKDDVLVLLDPGRLDAMLAEARAKVTAANALVSQRVAERARDDSDLRMKRALFKKEAISESELLDAEREATVAVSLEQSARDSHAAVQAAVTLLEVRQGDLEVKAPFDGRVVVRHAEPGEWARAGDPLITLVSTQLEAWLQVPERFAASTVNSAIAITVAGTGETVTASDLKPVPQSSQRSRVVEMIATLPATTSSLVPGLSVRAELPVSPLTARLAVPNDAITRSYAGAGVFRPKPAGNGPPLAERVPVQILFERDGMTFFESENLKEGDLVVTEGNERLYPQTPLLFEAPKLAAPSPLPGS